MKLVTKMRRFITKMESVETLTQKEMVKMLAKAQDIMTEYVEAEDRKDAAYIRMKQNSKYFRTKSPQDKASQEDVKTTTAVETEQNVSEPSTTSNEVAVTVQEQVSDSHQSTYEREELQMNNNEGRLVITKEREGHVIGAYHKNGDITYFSSSDAFDFPVAFGNPKVTQEIRDCIAMQKPNFYQPVTKNFKSVALFAKAGKYDAMVYLADAKRLVFEGYIGDYAFSTTQEYMNMDYAPLVTRADVFIHNGGRHNHVRDNMCSPTLKSLIFSLINQYKISPKFAKACNDIEYFSRLHATKRFNWQTHQQVNSSVTPQQTNASAGLGYGLSDIAAAMNATSVTTGGDDYEPEF